MKFNLNEFLIAVSFALDFVEMDVVGAKTNHSKRVAYTTQRIGEVLGFNSQELTDAISLAVLHDNGVSEYKLNEIINRGNNIASLENVKEHCIIGENNVVNYPFLNNETDVIKYHHENYDGTGFFHLKGDEIPLMAQIIGFSDYIDNNYKLDKLYGDYKRGFIEDISKIRGQKFSKELCDVYLEIISKPNYRLDVKDDFISPVLRERLQDNYLDLNLDEIHNITTVFSNIIDAKSNFTRTHSKGLAEKAAIMADFYNYSADEKIKLVIAADLHDIGKLAVPNSILDAPRKLTTEEFTLIEAHTYYTRAALSQIHGFEDITEWAANHHEKLNGRGYPYGKKAEELDFNSRLMGCLDIYQALTEERPYRKGLSHDQTIKIMSDMVSGGFIDGDRVNDINSAF